MISIKGTLFGYPGCPIAGPIDLTIEQREIVAIVGPSGCGKTTILRTLSGELAPLEGSIQLDGRAQDREWLIRHLARTLQNFPLLHWLTVEENLRLASGIRGVNDLDVDRVLSDFSALHLKGRYPKGLSGGERCRASLAQAALAEPRVLLLDEPFTGLDLHVKEEIAQRLFSFAASHQTGILFVTHDLHDACAYAKRVVVLGGKSPFVIRAVVETRHEGALASIRASMLGVN